MRNRDAVMNYILTCLQGLVEGGLEIKPDSDLVNDLSIPINILLDVRTPEQLLDALLPRLEKTNGSL